LKSARDVTSPIVSPANSATFEISPRPVFVDQEVHIQLDGLQPRQSVRIRALTDDDEGRRWTSCAEFRADSSGRVDLVAQESLGGTYHGVSPMGLLWSMKLANEHSDGPAIFAKKDASPSLTVLEADINGRAVARVRLERNFLALGTVIRDININGAPGESSGHVARLFIPPRVSRSLPPVVIVLGGSGGGFDIDKAAVLSRHGFAALALAYFGTSPLPSWLHRIPLEYFEGALAWVSAQKDVDSRRIGVLGVSRGAELALLLGTRFPQIRSVAAFAPSSVSWAAGGRDKTTREPIPTWTWSDAPLPFAPLPLRRFMLRSAFPVAAFRRPVMFRNLFRAGLRNRDAVGRATIPVERVAGPILLVSGGDDHVWPAAEMSEAIVARLKRHRFGHAIEHFHYPRAGHMLRYPFLPTTSRYSRNPHLRNVRYSFGGTASADADAQADSWPRMIAFLRASL
jgi:dienelactone hydrolase